MVGATGNLSNQKHICLEGAAKAIIDHQEAGYFKITGVANNFDHTEYYCFKKRSLKS